MSFNIYWRPVPPPSGEALPQRFKHVISQRWFGHDGTLRGEVTLARNSPELNFLAGLKAGSRDPEVIDAVDAILKGLDEHGVIRIWIGDPDD